ncbi:MAG: TM0106 family RecB-like putative nuclease [bacterium]|nr:TM0106 family RecB-like putative nuclease [bacterium]
MPSKRDYLTGTDFYKYLQCPHWPYWDRFGDPADRRPLTASEEKRLLGGLEHEERVIQELGKTYEEVAFTSIEEGFQQTLTLMQSGAPLIYQGWLKDGDWVGRPDLLQRAEGESALGSWYYIPIDIKQAHELKKEHKAQLTFYALLLEKIQKRFPSAPSIINADHQCLPFHAEDFLDEFRQILEAIERIRNKELPEAVYRKACVDTSPWGSACFRLAKERNDIALLFNVDVKKLKALRDLGIRTVEDAAALNVDALEQQAKGLTARALGAVQRQAQSLKDDVVIIREPFKDPNKGLEIHFDIESHPPTDRDYLYGFWICDEHPHYEAFVAERPEDEENMWRAFIAWLPNLPAEYTVYHYGVYELARLTLLSQRYGDVENPWLERFRSRMVNLQETVKDHAVFPIYFYSLKAIGKFLGFSWKGSVTQGGASIDAYDAWRTTGDRTILESIMQYNKEDVQATAWLLTWLRNYAQTASLYPQPFAWGLLTDQGERVKEKPVRS